MEYGIKTIDCLYVRPLLACAYLIVDSGKATFVENNTTHAVPLLLDALDEAGLKKEDVENIIITHVHLDHAGGTGKLVSECPNARVLCHPRAAKHLVDPSRLVASASQVYGEENFKRLYGAIVPVSEEKVQTLSDGETLQFGKRKLTFIHTRGHANHHFCIHDSLSNGIFTGDSFGLGYPIMQEGEKPYLFPSTSPTDFDPKEARISVEKILDTGADKAYLTHFGVWEDMEAGKQMMLAGIDAMEKILELAISEKWEKETLEKKCIELAEKYLLDLAKDKGLDVGEAELTMLRMDAELNGQGIAFQVLKRTNQL